MTNRSWDAYLIGANKARFGQMPKKFQEIIIAAFDEGGIGERADIARLSVSLRKDLIEKSMTFNDTEAAPFHAALVKSPYYGEWKKKFGAEPWKLLEDVVGPLA
jgi:TRAP-type C4-dicarboxylate transport system substrate-binding protein